MSQLIKQKAGHEVVCKKGSDLFRAKNGQPIRVKLL